MFPNDLVKALKYTTHPHAPVVHRRPCRLWSQSNHPSVERQPTYATSLHHSTQSRSESSLRSLMGLYVSHREQKSLRPQKSRNLGQKTPELEMGGSAAQATRTSLGESAPRQGPGMQPPGEGRWTLGGKNSYHQQSPLQLHHQVGLMAATSIGP